jgi:uncharacterized protein (DUF2225 family)
MIECKMNATEIECPICDRKIQSDITKCPNCGAALLLSSFEDLEEVARNLSTNEIIRPSETKVDSKEPSLVSVPKIEEMKTESTEKVKMEGHQPMVEPKKEEKVISDPNKDESKHGLGRLFGKKRK